jgi:hypothetical protein
MLANLPWAIEMFDPYGIILDKFFAEVSVITHVFDCKYRKVHFALVGIVF